MVLLWLFKWYALYGVFLALIWLSVSVEENPLNPSFFMLLGFNLSKQQTNIILAYVIRG